MVQYVEVVWIFLDTYVACFLADFRDTWAFLDARVHDAFDLKKSVQEVLLYTYCDWFLNILSIDYLEIEVGIFPNSQS